MNYKRLLIIVPAFNEEATISSVIKSIRRNLPSSNLVIINDGSTDKTAEIARNLKVGVISLPLNLGIGGAVQVGLKYAQIKGFNTVVQIDADGQHDPKELPKLLKEIHRADLVIGSRFLNKSSYHSSFLRFLGNRVFSLLIWFTTGVKITDSTSGYRVFTKKAIDFFSEHYPSEFPEPRSIVTFLKSGYRIKEVGIQMKKRQGGSSSVTNSKAIYLMLSIPIAIVFESIKTKKSIHG